MTLDLTGITSKAAIHQLFKEQLGFEEWYGPSWDAFWDSIVAIVEMPPVLTLTHWEEFARCCPRDMQILRQVMQDYAVEMHPKQIVLGWMGRKSPCGIACQQERHRTFGGLSACCLMKYRLLPALLLPAAFATAQPTARPPQTIALPPELADKNNQFSGLYLHGRELLLLSESRLQEQAEAKVYGLPLASLKSQLSGQPRELPYRKYPLRGLDQLRTRIDSLGQVYEGLESLTVLNGVLYFTVETATAAPYCYLIKGRFDAAHTAIQLDPAYLVALAKPTLPNGAHVYNAGFEALARYRRHLLMLFEYNAFPPDNKALLLPAAATRPTQVQSVPMATLPFRVTDMVRTGRGRYTAINYFFNGPDDTVYRPAPPDASARLVLDSAGRYQNYCRLVSLRYRRRQLRWQPLLELPRPYMTYNWEGLAAYRGGYFLLNDKYGPSGQSTLLYIRQK